MKIKLPLDTNKNYIVVPWKENTLAVFSEDNFNHYKNYLLSKINVHSRYAIRSILAYSCFIEYNRGWDIPNKLLSYMNYNGHIELIKDNKTDNSPLYIIKKS